MTLGALIDSGIDAEPIRAGIASLGLDGVELRTDTVIKGGFRATYVRVEHPEQHAHRHLADIHRLIDPADAITDRQKHLAKRLFGAVASAEATVHGSTIDKVHFHEVGAIDSIVDIVGAAIGFDLLGADRITASPIPTGRGRIRIDHGICPVPAPGTAELLKGIPLEDVPLEAELTTPTGAAIIRTMVDGFSALPAMTIETIGYGAGTLDFPGRANLLRIFVGQGVLSPETDVISLLETNLDDVTGEVIGNAKSQLFDAGALDVFTTPIQMKKDRPGIQLSVICKPADAADIEAIVFRETGTLGIRRHQIERSIRAREGCTVTTPWGPVRGKRAWRLGELESFAPEFDDCARVAGEHSVPVREVYRAAEAAFEPAVPAPARDGHGYIHDHDHSHDHDHDHHHHH